MTPLLKWLKEKIIEAFKISDEVMRGKAVETIEHEVAELDTDFWIEKYLKETTNQIKETYKSEAFRIRQKVADISIVIDRIVINLANCLKL